MNKSFAVLTLLTAAGLPHHALAQESNTTARLDQHDTRFNTLEHNINSIKDLQQAQGDKIEWIDGSTFRAHDRINGLDIKTDTTNTAILQVTMQLNAQNTALNDHDLLIQNNAKSITEATMRLDNLQNEVAIKASAASVDAMTRHVGDISNQVVAIEGNVTQLAQQAAQLNSKAVALDAHAVAVDTQAHETEARTARLEQRSDTHEARTTVLEGRAETLHSHTQQLEKTQAITNRQVETNRQDILRINHTVTDAIIVNNEAHHAMASNNQRLDGLHNDIHRVDQASIARTHRAIAQSTQYTNQIAAELHREIRSVRNEERAGIASVTALSAIPDIAGKTFDIGVGVGSFKNSSAVAIGAHYRPSDNSTFKLGVATAENSDPVIGAGFSCGW